MTLIITSGILVIGMEFSTLIASSIRLARNTDNALIARYASESAIESALHQLRKEELTVLRENQGTVGSARWTFVQDAQNPLDPIKFSPTIPWFEKHLVEKESVTQFSLYTSNENGTLAIPNLKAMSISWQGIDGSCAANPAPDGTPPGIETSILKWNGGAIDWSSADMLKNYQQPQSTSTLQVTVDFEAIEEGLSQKPMVVRVKPYFCDISGVKIALLDAENKTISIPNYFLLKPLGIQNKIQQELTSIVPANGTLSDIFDFALFSESQVVKQD